MLRQKIKTLLKNQCHWILLTSLFHCFPSFSFANEEAAVLTKPQLLETGGVVSLFVGMLFILVLIIGLALVLKRLQFATMSQHQKMKVLGTLPLGAREKIIIVQVKEQQLLLGVTPQNINVLKELEVTETERVAVEELNNKNSQTMNVFPLQRFSEVFSRQLKK